MHTTDRQGEEQGIRTQILNCALVLCTRGLECVRQCLDTLFNRSHGRCIRVTVSMWLNPVVEPTAVVQEEWMGHFNSPRISYLRSRDTRRHRC
jgi:hypothetical protein